MKSLHWKDLDESALKKALTHDFFPEDIDDIERAYDEQPISPARECQNLRMEKKIQNQEWILNYFLEANEHTVTAPANFISETEEDIPQRVQSLDMDNLELGTNDVGITKHESDLFATDSPCEASPRISHHTQCISLRNSPPLLVVADNGPFREM